MFISTILEIFHFSRKIWPVLPSREGPKTSLDYFLMFDFDCVRILEASAFEFHKRNIRFGTFNFLGIHEGEYGLDFG